MQVPGVGEGIAKIGDSLSRLGMQLFEADAAREATVAVGQAYQEFSKFRAGLSQDYDYTTWEQRFTEGSDDSFARISETIKNPIARKRFEAEFQSIKAREFETVISKAQERLADRAVTDYATEVTLAVQSKDKARLASTYALSQGIVEPSTAKKHYDLGIASIDKSVKFDANNTLIMNLAANGEDYGGKAAEMRKAGILDEAEYGAVLGNGADAMQAVQMRIDQETQAEVQANKGKPGALITSLKTLREKTPVQFRAKQDELIYRTEEEVLKRNHASFMAGIPITTSPGAALSTINSRLDKLAKEESRATLSYTPEHSAKLEEDVRELRSLSSALTAADARDSKGLSVEDKKKQIDEYVSALALTDTYSYGALQTATSAFAKVLGYAAPLGDVLDKWKTRLDEKLNENPEYKNGIRTIDGLIDPKKDKALNEVVITAWYQRASTGSKVTAADVAQIGKELVKEAIAKGMTRPGFIMDSMLADADRGFGDSGIEHTVKTAINKDYDAKTATIKSNLVDTFKKDFPDVAYKESAEDKQGEFIITAKITGNIAPSGTAYKAGEKTVWIRPAIRDGKEVWEQSDAGTKDWKPMGEIGMADNKKSAAAMLKNTLTAAQVLDGIKKGTITAKDIEGMSFPADVKDQLKAELEKKDNGLNGATTGRPK